MGRCGRTRLRGATAAAGLTAVALSLAACSGSSDASSSGPTGEASGEITVWSWSTNASDLADAFMEEHPDITVDIVDPGGGTATMEKLLTAFQSGSGAPDVAMMEYNFIPQFALTEDIVPLDEYGGDEIVGDYIDSIASQITVNGKLYGTPIDAAPMAFAYREDILKAAGVEPPKTWEEYAAAAEKLHAANPKAFLSNNPIADGTLRYLLWQTGETPFEVDGEEIAVDYQKDAFAEVLSFWQDMAQRDLTADLPAFSPEWNAAFADGTLAGWIAPAWAPVILGASAESSAGKWRVSQMPTWDAGERASAEWGGSAYTVTSQSDNAAAAAEYVMWVNHDPKAYEMLYDLTGSFPVLKQYVEDDEFLSQPFEFFGGQPVNQVFAEELQAVPQTWQWSPFNSTVNTVTGEAFTALREGEVSADEALSSIQEQLVQYAEEQGFTVK
jgi:multiple sugar transport system substrate-binding protein